MNCECSFCNDENSSDWINDQFKKIKTESFQNEFPQEEELFRKRHNFDELVLDVLRNMDIKYD